jgi:iron complex outermembrane recepter protein
MRIIYKLFLMVFVLSICSTVFAVEGEEKTNIQTKDETNLEEIVVTATRTEKEVESAPGDVHVVTKKEIEQRNIKTVDEALNTTPGVFNRRGKGLMDTLANISLRGIPGANRTLILKDGLPLNNAYTGDVAWGMSSDNIERIEIVEGPFSSLYGGYAMGGVVNIITKMPEQREFTLKSGYGTSWDRGEAMDDLKRLSLSYGDKIKDTFTFFVSYGYEGTNGFPTDLNVQSKAPTTASGITGWLNTPDNKGAARYVIGDKGDNTWWDDIMSIKAGYDFSKVTKLTASFGRTRSEYNRDAPHTFLRDTAGQPVYTYVNGTTTIRENSFVSGNGGTEINTYAIIFETEIGAVKAKLNAGLNDLQKNWYTTPNSSTPYATISGGPGKVSSTPAQNYYSDIQFTVPLFNKHVLTVGGSFKYDKADNEEHNLTNWKGETSTTNLTYTAGGKDQTYSLFAQDEIMILNNLTAYAGLRQDWWETKDGYANSVGAAGYPKSYDSRSASSFSPKFAIVYKPFYTTTVRSSVGKAFRAPTVYELYRTWLSSTGVTYKGNPDLKPETTTSWDISIEQGVWKGAKVKATYFENYLEDLIYRKTVSATQQDYINAGKAESKGIVVEMEQKIEWLKIFGNATFTDAKIKENSASPASVGKKLTQMPDRLFNIGAEVEKGPVFYSLTGSYVSKRYGSDDNSDIVNGVWTSYDPYFTLNTKIAYKITKNATLSFSVDNILDRKYFAYYQCPGRSWFTDLTLKF